MPVPCRVSVSMQEPGGGSPVYLAWHGGQITQASGRGLDAAKSRTDKLLRHGALIWQASQRPGSDRAGRSLRSVAGINDHQVTRAQARTPCSSSLTLERNAAARLQVLAAPSFPRARSASAGNQMHAPSLWLDSRSALRLLVRAFGTMRE